MDYLNIKSSNQCRFRQNSQKKQRNSILVIRMEKFPLSFLILLYFVVVFMRVSNSVTETIEILIRKDIIYL